MMKQVIDTKEQHNSPIQEVGAETRQWKTPLPMTEMVRTDCVATAHFWHTLTVNLAKMTVHPELR